jgi:hypothetical protein
MYGKPAVGLIIVVTTFRKSKGGKRDGRSNSSGKRGQIFRNSNGQCGEKLFDDKGATFAELSKKLRKTGLIPEYAAIKHCGVTHI